MRLEKLCILDNMKHLFVVLCLVCESLIGVSQNITTVAGTGFAGTTGDSGPATNAKLDYPASLAVDKYGNYYFAEVSSNRIRVVATTGEILFKLSTIACLSV